MMRAKQIRVRPDSAGADVPLSPLIDCHAHLADTAFDGDRHDVLRRARAAGVAGVIAVGETLAEARRNLSLAEVHRELLPTAGLFPTHIDLDEASRVEEWIRSHCNRLVAIGEVGLDHWKVQDPSEREVQAEIFRRFTRLSVELDLPLNVHSRSAGARAISLLIEQGARRVQLHAFDGRPARAMAAVEAGFLFSIPASIVRSRQKQKLVRRLPLERLLLETDSPVLSPDPGKRNEPAQLRLALAAVAEIKEKSEAYVAEIVLANTLSLYPAVDRLVQS